MTQTDYSNTDNCPFKKPLLVLCGWCAEPAAKQYLQARKQVYQAQLNLARLSSRGTSRSRAGLYQLETARIQESQAYESMLAGKVKTPFLARVPWAQIPEELKWLSLGNFANQSFPLYGHILQYLIAPWQPKKIEISHGACPSCVKEQLRLADLL